MQQPRERDGRYGEVPRQESPVRLQRIGAHTDDDAYNASGSFEFPPPARSYEQMVAFWSKVHVSDTVVRQMQIGYVELMHERAQEAYGQWVADNPAPARFTKGRFGRADEPNPDFSRWQAAYLDEQERVESIHPLDIDPTIARDLARAARMRWQAERSAGWLPDIVENVDDTTIEIAGLGHVRIGDLLDRYPVHELDEAVWRDQTPETIGFIADQLAALAARDQQG